MLVLVEYRDRGLPSIALLASLALCDAVNFHFAITARLNGRKRASKSFVKGALSEGSFFATDATCSADIAPSPS